MANFTALLMLVCSLGLMLLVYIQLDQPVDRVMVRGQLDGAERSQVREAVAAALDGGLLSSNLDALSEEIFQLGWPRSVAIRRDWPGALVIEVEKPAVVARWRDAYLASDGRVIKLPTERGGLPKFDCATSEPRRAMEVYHRLNEIAAGSGLAIVQLKENLLGEWDLTFRTPNAEMLTVRLGSESVDDRLDRFALVYRQQLAGRAAEIESVDARYDNGVAVSWVAQEELVALAGEPRSESI
jgi:cell division protein FtsQ